MVPYLATYPRCREAYEFNTTFAPVEGVDYGWVLKQAEARYALAVSKFKDTDDKAGVVVTALGGGAGLLTVGSLVALSAGQVHPAVVLFALPSVGLALRSIRSAIECRRTAPLMSPADVPAGCRLAEHWGDRGAAASLGPWTLTLALMDPVQNAKAYRLDRAMSLFGWSITALLLPLAVGLGLRFLAGEKPHSAPPQVNVTLQTPTPTPADTAEMTLPRPPAVAPQPIPASPIEPPFLQLPGLRFAPEPFQRTPATKR